MDDWLMPGIPRTIAEDPDMETVRRIRASVTSDTGQVVESDMLKPCPFCGARPYVQVHELGETCVEARVVCPSCHVSTTREYDLHRVYELRRLGVNPFVMPYDKSDPYQRALARWCNNKFIFKACRDFWEYEGAKKLAEREVEV